MTQDEGNKIIAEFMKEEGICAIFQTEPFVTEVRISYSQIDQLKNQGAEVRLYYHDNWNKLMPVVEKIESMWIDGAKSVCKMEGLRVQIWHEVGYNNIDFASALYDGKEKMINAWKAVIEFIKWYNSQQTKIKPEL